MSATVIGRVTGRRLSGSDARIRHFKRHCITGESYPGVIRQAGCNTEGILYRNLPPAAVRRLDRFEGRWYRRTRVSVITANGRRICADTYLFKHRRRLAPREWRYERFCSESEQDFMKRYKGFL